MPEQVSKYPDITLKVLKEGGARCGEGAPQKILKQCPADRFCALPTGEICVYGLDDIPTMTQITKGEFARVVCPKHELGMASAADMTAVAALVIGLVAGRFWRHYRKT